MAIGTHTTLTTEELFSEQKTREGGLTAAEATHRLAEHGPNALDAHPVSWFSILIRQIKSPFVYILAGTAVLALLLGEVSDGVIVIIFVLVNVFISFFHPPACTCPS